MYDSYVRIIFQNNYDRNQITKTHRTKYFKKHEQMTELCNRTT